MRFRSLVWVCGWDSPSSARLAYSSVAWSPTASPLSQQLLNTHTPLALGNHGRQTSAASALHLALEVRHEPALWSQVLHVLTLSTFPHPRDHHLALTAKIDSMSSQRAATVTTWASLLAPLCPMAWHASRQWSEASVTADVFDNLLVAVLNDLAHQQLRAAPAAAREKPSLEPAHPAAPAPEPPTFASCSSCAAPLQSAWSHCPHCGQEITKPR